MMIDARKIRILTVDDHALLRKGIAALIAVPMFVMVWLVAWLTIYTNSRLTLALGLTLVAVASWICSRVDTAWAANNFGSMHFTQRSN